MRTRQASARLVGTSEYLSISQPQDSIEPVPEVEGRKDSAACEKLRERGTAGLAEQVKALG
jgi:hypothetical protein